MESVDAIGWESTATTLMPNRDWMRGHTVWNARTGSNPVSRPGANTIVVLPSEPSCAGGSSAEISSAPIVLTIRWPTRCRIERLSTRFSGNGAWEFLTARASATASCMKMLR